MSNICQLYVNYMSIICYVKLLGYCIVHLIQYPSNFYIINKEVNAVLTSLYV